MKRILSCGLLIGMLVAGCGTASLADATHDLSVRVTRTPGLFILPALAVTITDPSMVNELLDDIRRLPPMPAGVMSCPVDFGTSYTLQFRSSGTRALTAVIAAQGCREVQMSDGRLLWAATSPSLFFDLGTALHLTQDELIPSPCPPRSGSICYPQPSPAA
ncbi:MAG: hypothetical protein ACYDCS_07670 [Candidatus Dormibacteria bacterium]